jgi:hypothetical protein
VDQLRFGNVGTSDTTVTVTIGGTEVGSYLLGPSEQERVFYDVDDGPVVVTSDGEPIIAAVLDAWKVRDALELDKPGGGKLKIAKGTTTSYVQLMGLPATSLSDSYYFPAYNNITLAGQLRFGVP